MIPEQREDEDEAYDVPTVARKLGGITERTVWNLIAAKELPSFKAGRRRLVSRRALRGYIERQEAAELEDVAA